MIGSSAKGSRSGGRKPARKKSAAKPGASSRKQQGAKAHRRMPQVRSWLVNPLDYLPPAVSAFLTRRAVEGAGVVLMALAGFGLLAVLSWPSLNNATTRLPGNWMGLPGA